MPRQSPLPSKRLKFKHVGIQCSNEAFNVSTLKISARTVIVQRLLHTATEKDREARGPWMVVKVYPLKKTTLQNAKNAKNASRGPVAQSTQPTKGSISECVKEILLKRANWIVFPMSLFTLFLPLLWHLLLHIASMLLICLYGSFHNSLGFLVGSHGFCLVPGWILWFLAGSYVLSPWLVSPVFLAWLGIKSHIEQTWEMFNE